MKERNKIRLGALIAFILLMGMCYAFGQVTTAHRYDNRPDILSVMPENPVEFGYTEGSSENLKVGIIKDIISKDSIIYKLFAYMPKGKSVKDYEFVLKFADGSFYKFDATKMHDNLNMAEYEILPDGLTQLKIMKVDAVMIRYLGDVFVGGFTDKAYFQNFLQL